MNRAVFDASAMLALIQNERGSELLTDALCDAAIASTVNMAEVEGKLILNGWEEEQAWRDALACIGEVVPQTARQAKLAGALLQKTRQYGLSLGDRSCLALALILQAPVYTTERIWAELSLEIPIHVIR